MAELAVRYVFVSDPGEKRKYEAYVKAYAKFADKVRNTDLQLANDWIDRVKALQTLQTLLKGLVNPIGTFASQANSLYRRGKLSPAAAASKAGKAWLTWNFGIKPTLGSIYELMELLEKPYPPIKVSAAASVKNQKVIEKDMADAQIGFKGCQVTISHGCRIAGELTISNPNLYLLNQLGLANPGSVLWEATPFSWLLDYMVNIGQVIQSYTDLVGVTLGNTYHTHYEKGQVIANLHLPYWTPDVFTTGTCNTVRMERILGIPRPPVVFKPKLTMTRAANIAAVAFDPVVKLGRKLKS